MIKGENHPALEFLKPEAGVADVKVALFAEVFDLLGDDDDFGSVYFAKYI